MKQIELFSLVIQLYWNMHGILNDINCNTFIHFAFFQCKFHIDIWFAHEQIKDSGMINKNIR